MKTDRLRLELTKEQQDQIKEASGQGIRAVELNVQELEQRVAPAIFLKLTMSDVFVS